MDRKAHWDRIYTTKAPDEVSWFQSEPAASLRLLDGAGMTAESCVIDIGGGDSRLVDRLLDRGLHCLFVLDISAAALARAKARLGVQERHVTWIEADVTAEWNVPSVDIWHDRAVVSLPDRRIGPTPLRRTDAPVGQARRLGGHRNIRAGWT